MEATSDYPSATSHINDLVTLNLTGEKRKSNFCVMEESDSPKSKEIPTQGAFQSYVKVVPERKLDLDRWCR